MLKVLVVDDSEAVQQSLGRLLGSVPGVGVVAFAADVPAAIDRIEATQPDVVVLDADLGQGQRGIDVLDYIRREHPDTQVIALSNLTWHAVRVSYLAAGAKAYFDKSTEFEQARDWIAALCEPGGRR